MEKFYVLKGYISLNDMLIDFTQIQTFVKIPI